MIVYNPYFTANLGQVPSLISITEAQNYSQHFKIFMLKKGDLGYCQILGSTSNLLKTLTLVYTIHQGGQ